LNDGVLHEYNDNHSAFKWTVLKLNNRELIVTDVLENEKATTHYYIKLTGYNSK
jgi:hypothetical protein